MPVERITFDSALLNLCQANMVEMNNRDEGGVEYQIGGLVHRFLIDNYPPSDHTVTSTRKAIQAWEAKPLVTKVPFSSICIDTPYAS